MQIDKAYEQLIYYIQYYYVHVGTYTAHMSINALSIRNTIVAAVLLAWLPMLFSVAAIFIVHCQAMPANSTAATIVLQMERA